VSGLTGLLRFERFQGKTASRLRKLLL